MIDLLPPPVDTPVQQAAVEAELDCVRELTADEIQSFVRPFYEKTGNSLPDPATSTFLGAVRDGKVVAAIGLQLRLHAQPLMVSKGYTPVVSALVAGAEEHILRKAGPQWVYLFVPAGHMSQLAQSFGMALEPWNVLSKLVMPAAPAKDLFEFNPVEVEENVIIRAEQHDENSGEQSRGSVESSPE